DNDTLYHNVNNLVYATKSVTIGSTTNAGTIAVSLARAVAGLTVQLYPATTTTFDPSIDSIRVYVGLIAYQLNFFTAAPSNQTCTVLVPLRFSPTRASAYNRVTLFPSAATPWFRIELTLANGSVKSYTTHLSQALSAGTMMTVTVNIGEILETPSGGNGFEVSNWKESSETIDIGPI
ncbi:MAG: FimB/Mfa2 family fimbrial subunit, partial [Alistipes sp.]|nr:FimB/Mfa2 family fimbrial subunit [Alistipes sp.]